MKNNMNIYIIKSILFDKILFLFSISPYIKNF